MKTWPLIISIIVILAFVCSPALAIGKSDLISQYKAGYFPGPTTLTPTPVLTPSTPSWYPKPTPTFPSAHVPEGSLAITSNPSGAIVFVDFTLFGVTPITISPISAKSPPCEGWCWGASSGFHQIKLTKTGYQDYTTTVTVLEGTTSTVSATLIPVEHSKGEVIPKPVPTQAPTAPWTGKLSVTSAPSGAPVFFDGVYKGTTPINITGVAIGPHTLRVTLGGIEHSAIVSWGRLGWQYQELTDYPLEVHVTTQGIEYYDVDDILYGKPNIYLYSNHDIIAQVRLAPEQAITVSEPAYQPGKGWRAEIRNGTLNGKGDFLFYEALGSDYEWQKEEGYIIRAAHRQQDMAFMLGQYGFNEKETLEFIDYWASHLIGDMDFVFYPQETDAVNQDMPLSIIPKPDHVMRIWFYAEPLVSAPEPVTSPERIVREGFYVVEWGVIIDDEYWMNHSPVRSEVLL